MNIDFDLKCTTDGFALEYPVNECLQTITNGGQQIPPVAFAVGFFNQLFLATTMSVDIRPTDNFSPPVGNPDYHALNVNIVGTSPTDVWEITIPGIYEIEFGGTFNPSQGALNGPLDFSLEVVINGTATTLAQDVIGYYIDPNGNQIQPRLQFTGKRYPTLSAGDTIFFRLVMNPNPSSQQLEYGLYHFKINLIR